LERCHDLVFGELKRLSHTGFAAECADGVQRTVFPALHSYVSDTPEAHRLAALMNWPAACSCCDMPRDSSGRTLEDIVQPGRWPFRTVAAHDALQDQADAAAAAAEAANHAAAQRWQSGAKTSASPEDPAAGLRAAYKFCKARGIIWGRSVFRCVCARARARTCVCVWRTRVCVRARAHSDAHLRVW
jgi:hypothetical protein